MAEFLQHSCGPAGAATAHDVQRKHEATTAPGGTNLQQLSASLPSFKHINTFKVEHSSFFTGHTPVFSLPVLLSVPDRSLYATAAS